jgi:hypothetical protein
MTPEWVEIQIAVTNKDKKRLKELGEMFSKPRLQQEGVKAEEVAEQVLSMAPGGHPLLGPLLLDLSEKL